MWKKARQLMYSVYAAKGLGNQLWVLSNEKMWLKIWEKSCYIVDWIN